MLRVGGFWELSPSKQKLFDRLVKSIEKVYKKWGYEHIYTPAVEKNEILLAKGGDEVSGQIFGLYGLKQGCEKDKKDYSLRFDLTVPLARYVLDRRHELKFPFKRYQIQPVWRGERQQKGRFKEFFQADIDIIFEGEGELWYDVETLIVIGNALEAIWREFSLKGQVVIKINSKKIINFLIDELSLAGKKNKILSILDKYYKLGLDKFKNLLHEEIGEEAGEQLLDMVLNKSRLLSSLKEGEVLGEQINQLKKWQKVLGLTNIGFEFDPFIVRGLDYYTGLVFESFVVGNQDLGSIASGGRYEGLTSYIDPKTNFGGVGGSIGVNRLFSWIEMVVDDSRRNNQYLIARFEGIDISNIVKKFLNDDKNIRIYPEADSLKKQIKFADKKKIRYVVIIGEDELKKEVYKVKDLEKGLEKTYPLKIKDDS